MNKKGNIRKEKNKEKIDNPIIVGEGKERRNEKEKEKTHSK